MGNEDKELQAFHKEVIRIHKEEKPLKKKVLSSYWHQMKICWPMEDLKQMNRLSLL